MTIIKFDLFTILSLSFFVVLVKSQGESCTDNANYRGVCEELTKCDSLITLYRNSPSQATIDILIANQRSCGNRKNGRTPLMCCKDGVPQDVAPPAQQNLGPPCSTPDSISGYCINVKQCKSVLDTFLQRQKDPEYITHIRQSNANCNYASQVICCPNSNSQTQPPSQTGGVAPRSSGLPLPPQCGVSKVPHNRVVGGAPAMIGGWPWMALLGYRNSVGEVGWRCGGSIISSRHILTAAHCIRNDLVVARLGEHDLSTDTETKHIDMGVKQKITHPDYDKSDGHSDLAILVLDSDIPFTPAIQPVCMPLNEPEHSLNVNRYTPFAAGWGRTQEGGKSANVLQELQIPIITNDRCKTSYANINKVLSTKQFDDGVLCAGYPDDGKDTCNGDSGGPFMLPLQNKGQYYYYQIGVVSYGVGCARGGIPGVYARVQHYTDWIRRTVEST